MTVRDGVKWSAAVVLMGLLGACQSAANAGYETGYESHAQLQANPEQLAYGQTQKIASFPSPTAQETQILEQVIDEREALGLCQDSFNLEQSKVGSQLYPTGPEQYLIQLQCFQAAYQGNYAFAVATVESSQVQLRPLSLSLAGYPNYDPQTQILSNAYKFRGVGDCVEATEHRWTGHELRLLTSTLESYLPDSCDAFTGGDSYRITPTQVGLAELGMTFGQLKAVMGDYATFRSVPLGVDMGMGIEVSMYGEVQFEVASDTGAPLGENAVISWIRVDNPLYRTAAGVGPGTPLKQAIASYGPATLSLNHENESREFIQFEQEIAQTMVIRSNQWALDGEAGVYDNQSSSYRTTTQFKDKAAIGSLTITAQN